MAEAVSALKAAKPILFRTTQDAPDVRDMSRGEYQQHKRATLKTSISGGHLFDEAPRWRKEPGAQTIAQRIAVNVEREQSKAQEMLAEERKAMARECATGKGCEGVQAAEERTARRGPCAR